MGPIELPEEALYGASTQRAIQNFPVSGYRIERSLIRAIGLIKTAAAETNQELGRLPENLAKLIIFASTEVANGTHDIHFPVDVFQTGSGTSTNMNANEVIANRCSQLSRFPLGSHSPVHPNDHVNLGQSSNDVFPTSIHVAIASALTHELAPTLENLASALSRKTTEFWDVLKIGRTHLMDATPIRLGQEFSGYRRQIELAVGRVHSATAALYELPLGGTAVGTGLNTHRLFAKSVIARLRKSTGIPWVEAANHFEAQSAKDAVVEASGHLKTIALSLFKIANDIRWLACGPRIGIAEIQLPETQPGSSMMPGKVNPVICEALLQACTRVIGNDTTVCWAAGSLSNFELNVGMPVIAYAMLESIRLLTNSCHLFQIRCLEGITANKRHCEASVENSISLVTQLVPQIGYDKAARIAKECASSGKTVREVCIENQILPQDILTQALNPIPMTRPSG